MVSPELFSFLLKSRSVWWTSHRVTSQGWTVSGDRMRYKVNLYSFRHSLKLLCSTSLLKFLRTQSWNVKSWWRITTFHVSLLDPSSGKHPQFFKKWASSILFWKQMSIFLITFLLIEYLVFIVTPKPAFYCFAKSWVIKWVETKATYI